jgi:hypothetical protein
MNTFDIIAEKILFPWLLAAPFVAGGGLLVRYLDNHTAAGNWVLAPLLMVVIVGGLLIGNGLAKRILR